MYISCFAASPDHTILLPAVVEMPRLLARFKVNQNDTLAVFMATTAEDFKDVAMLLPNNSSLPASNQMSYLLARLEVRRAEQQPMWLSQMITQLVKC